MRMRLILQHKICFAQFAELKFTAVLQNIFQLHAWETEFIFTLFLQFFFYIFANFPLMGVKEQQCVNFTAPHTSISVLKITIQYLCP